MPNLVLLAGVPGTGKSTWAKTFFDLKYSIVSSDEIRKQQAGSLREAHREKMSPWDQFYAVIEDRLKHSVDVVADATFLTRKHRTRAREVADRTAASLHLVLFKDWFTALDRNQAREAETRVPDKAMEGMMKLYFDTLAQIVQEAYATVTKIEAFS